MTESMLELLKQNKCFCLKKQMVIELSECTLTTCHREKGCRQSTNRKVDKEMNNGRKKQTYTI